MPLQRVLCTAARLSAAVLLALSPAVLSATDFNQIDLVSNVPGLAANTDSNLVNPWGVSFAPTSPFWISDQGAGKATLYTGTGATIPLVVSVPGGTPPVTGPTGQVFNSTSGFLVGTTPSHFIFDTLGGTIDAWGGGSAATVVATTPGAVYTGLALGSVVTPTSTSNYLYAADSTGQVRVFNSAFAQVTGTTFAGKFADPTLPSGFVPFNIQTIGSDLYVTYAKLTAFGTGLPGGIVDVYDTSGNLLSRFSSNSALYAPWGIAAAPASFGSYGGDLLIGNFGNGEINVFNPTTGTLLGTLDGTNGQPLVNDFLWSLNFRTGGTGIDPNALYFTAGIDNQTDGLFGEIAVTPEPESLILVALGTVSLAATRLRRFLPKAHSA